MEFPWHIDIVISGLDYSSSTALGAALSSLALPALESGPPGASDTGARARWAAGGASSVAIAPQPLLCIWHALPLLLQALVALASTSAALGLCCSLLATLDMASWARGRGEPGQRSSPHSHVTGQLASAWHGSGCGHGRRQGGAKGALDSPRATAEQLARLLALSLLPLNTMGLPPLRQNPADAQGCGSCRDATTPAVFASGLSS